jgi:ribosomal-protein-alanine N-acetyltransferase
MSDSVLISTDHLLLRHLAPGDAAPLARIWSDPYVTEFMGGPRDHDEIVQLLEDDIAADERPLIGDLWPLVDSASGDVIGHCGLLEKEIDGRNEVEVTYVLAAASWGKGLATEIATALVEYAFADLGLRRVVALIDPGNSASARVAEKAGLRRDRDTVRPGGKVMHVYRLDRA